MNGSLIRLINLSALLTLMYSVLIVTEFSGTAPVLSATFSKMVASLAASAGYSLLSSLVTQFVLPPSSKVNAPPPR
eukprot:10320324-Prorocentrum_lima.AAC.1